MNQEVKSILKKTVKIAGVTCFTAGAIAVLTSTAALKAIAEGGKYMADSIKKIVNEQEQPQEVEVEAEAAAPTEEPAAAEEAAPIEEAVVIVEVPAEEAL